MKKGGYYPAHRGQLPHVTLRGAFITEYPATDVRYRNSYLSLHERISRNTYSTTGHPENSSRPASTGQNGRTPWRWFQSPDGTLRYDHAERQPYQDCRRNSECRESRVKQNLPLSIKVEVETTNLEEVQQAVEAGADIIMLDNMSNEAMAEAVKLHSRQSQNRSLWKHEYPSFERRCRYRELITSVLVPSPTRLQLWILA